MTTEFMTVEKTAGAQVIRTPHASFSAAHDWAGLAERSSQVEVFHVGAGSDGDDISVYFKRAGEGQR
jgi:hypothetical protein